jgi:hypothetical protein
VLRSWYWFCCCLFLINIYAAACTAPYTRRGAEGQGCRRGRWQRERDAPVTYSSPTVSHSELYRPPAAHPDARIDARAGITFSLASSDSRPICSPTSRYILLSSSSCGYIRNTCPAPAPDADLANISNFTTVPAQTGHHGMASDSPEFLACECGCESIHHPSQPGDKHCAATRRGAPIHTCCTTVTRCLHPSLDCTAEDQGNKCQIRGFAGSDGTPKCCWVAWLGGNNPRPR